MQLTGVENADLNASLVVTTYHRMAGLLVTFVNSFILVLVVSHYEHIISSKPALVALLPIVGGMSGASGTQVIAVTVRALATRMLTPQNTLKVVLKEVSIGTLNGLIFSVILMVILMLWFNDWHLGLVLVIALIFNMTWSALTGVVLPIVVERLGLDPAISTGPVLTASTDVIGFISVLALATFLL